MSDRKRIWNIAICDDEAVFLEKIKHLTEQYCADRNLLAKIQCFKEAEEFLKSEIGMYDLILLDMNMNEKNGIEVVRSIHEKGFDTLIIFVSAHVEMAPRGYEVRAFRYLIKDDLDKTFYVAMDDAMKELKLHSETIQVKKDGVNIERKLYDVIFIESYKRYMLIHTPEEVYKEYGKISDMERTLKGKGFLRIYKSYLINMEHVTKIKDKIAYMDNKQELMCSRDRYQEIMQEYAIWKGK